MHNDQRLIEGASAVAGGAAIVAANGLTFLLLAGPWLSHQPESLRFPVTLGVGLIALVLACVSTLASAMLLGVKRSGWAFVGLLCGSMTLLAFVIVLLNPRLLAMPYRTIDDAIQQAAWRSSTASTGSPSTVIRTEQVGEIAVTLYATPATTNSRTSHLALAFFEWTDSLYGSGWIWQGS